MKGFVTLAIEQDPSKVSKDNENQEPEVETVEEDGAEDASESGSSPDAVEDAVLIVEEESSASEEDPAPENEPEEVAVADVSEAMPSESAAATSSASAANLVVGGVAAGAIGFLVATFLVPDGSESELSTLRELVAAQEATIEGLSQQVASLQAEDSVDLGPIAGQVGDLSGGLEGLNAELTAALARISELEARPVVTVPAGEGVDFDGELEAFRAELEAASAAARAEVEAAEARAADVEAKAAAAAEIAIQRAALAEVAAALESGSPFAAALSNLPDAPEALQSLAEQGVPTMSALRQGFPDAARSALSDVQAVPDEASAADRLTAFLRKQTNARSLSPREGEDADAILSRAEAALNVGDLPMALAELSGLPDGAKPALAEWIATAEQRSAAVDAVQAMSLGVK